MAEERMAVLLGPRDIREIEQAVLDHDAAAALDILKRVVKPQIDAAGKAVCKPFFESPGGRPGKS